MRIGPLPPVRSRSGALPPRLARYLAGFCALLLLRLLLGQGPEMPGAVLPGLPWLGPGMEAAWLALPAPRAPGLPGLGCQLLALCCLSVVLLGPPTRLALPELGLALAFAGTLAPLGLALAQGSGTVAASLAAMADPLLLLLLLFGARIAGLLTAWRFALAWNAPEEGHLPPPHGLAAAGLAGLLLTVLLSLWLETLPARPQTASAALLVAALRGSTLLHGLIILLFFTLLAALTADAWRLACQRAGLAALLARPDMAPAGAPEAVSPVWAMITLATPQPGLRQHDRATCRLALETAARRQWRALLPLLPMLGFLGTVIGLATAIAGLPGTMSAAGTADLSGALAGLAVKFETTLLGLAASMLLMLLLAWLERREAEFAAAVRLAVSGAGPEPPGMPA